MFTYTTVNVPVLALLIPLVGDKVIQLALLPTDQSNVPPLESLITMVWDVELDAPRVAVKLRVEGLNDIVFDLVQDMPVITIENSSAMITAHDINLLILPLSPFLATFYSEMYATLRLYQIP